MQRFRFYCALYLGKLASFACRLVSRSRGTNLPGAIALKIDPQLLRHFGELDPDKVVFITGTNGKSTTTNLLAHIFRTAGLNTVANLEGANLLAGVAVTLLRNADLAGNLRADYVLLETDERFLPLIHAQLPARHLCVTNIQKDQVQRNGEPDIIYRKIREAIDRDTTLYLNNDEPNAKSLARFVDHAVFYGVAPHEKSFHKDDDPYAVTMPCPICSAPLRFSAYNIDNIGPFSCPGCGFSSASAADGKGEEKDGCVPDYLAEAVDFAKNSFRVSGVGYSFRYATPYFLYCYIAALAVAREFGVDGATVERAFQSFVNVGGRMEDIQVGGKTIHYLRMKQENPETVQSALNVIAADPRQKIFLLGLDELVDFHPHYTNTFYAYDCDFRGLIASGVSRYICFSGTVAYDAALRLRYDGAPAEQISVLPTNDNAAILAELAHYAGEEVYLITWLKKYESLAAYVKKHAAMTAVAKGGATQ